MRKNLIFKPVPSTENNWYLIYNWLDCFEFGLLRSVILLIWIETMHCDFQWNFQLNIKVISEKKIPLEFKYISFVCYFCNGILLITSKYFPLNVFQISYYFVAISTINYCFIWKHKINCFGFMLVSLALLLKLFVLSWHDIVSCGGCEWRMEIIF